jgi:hypothetical protein
VLCQSNFSIFFFLPCTELRDSDPCLVFWLALLLLLGRGLALVAIGSYIITEANRIQVFLSGMRNRAFGSCLHCSVL